MCTPKQVINTKNIVLSEALQLKMSQSGTRVVNNCVGSRGGAAGGAAVEAAGGAAVEAAGGVAVEAATWATVEDVLKDDYYYCYRCRNSPKVLIADGLSSTKPGLPSSIGII